MKDLKKAREIIEKAGFSFVGDLDAATCSLLMKCGICAEPETAANTGKTGPALPDAEALRSAGSV